MLNKFSAIIGNCDLLIEKTEAGTPYTERLASIREIAETAVTELTEHQRQLEAETRRTDERKVG